MRTPKLANVDTLSALLDRLIVERIKRHYFSETESSQQVRHQDRVIAALRRRIAETFAVCLTQSAYDFLGELRTFPADAFIERLEALIENNLRVGEADREKLSQLQREIPDSGALLRNEVRGRKAIETRARIRGEIDQWFSDVVTSRRSKGSKLKQPARTPRCGDTRSRSSAGRSGSKKRRQGDGRSRA